MPNTSQYDVVVKVCDFRTPSKSAKKIIDGSYMINHVLNNPKWQDKLAKGMVLGLFTHKDRQPNTQCAQIPYEDNIAVSPYLCNVAKDVWVEGDNLIAGLNLFKDKDYGIQLMDMLRKGIKIPVSMSVKAHTDATRYYVDDLLGIDFTLKPDLEAEVLEVNFSNNSEQVGAGTYHFSIVPEILSVNFNDINFSSESNRELESNVITYSSNLEDDDTDEIEFCEGDQLFDPDSYVDFSLKTYLTELKLTPPKILKTRITEVVLWCKNHKQSEISEKAELLRVYISSYILQWVQKMLSNPDTQFNLIIGLRLNAYVEDRSKLMGLQRIMLRVRKQLQKSGSLTLAIQKEVNASYQGVLTEIWNYINKKLEPSKKVLK